MKQVDHFQGKKILILGLAKSGVSAAKLMQKLGAFVIVNDIKPLEGNVEAEELTAAGITVIGGHHPVELLSESFELVIKNPGIPYHNPMVARAIELAIPVITEVELAYQISEAPFVAVTGTNGKTTTTTLIYEMLRLGEKKPLIAGNIGTVACEVAEDATAENVIVIEMSSFQLMGIQEFRPKIAVLTNLFDTHLDYHGTRQAYLEAKLNVFRNQTSEDYVIYNGNQTEYAEAVRKSTSTSVAFAIDQTSDNQADVYVQDGWVYFRADKVVEVKKIVLPGRHSLENILAAIAAVKLLGVENAAIEEVLTTFQGVEHRFQFVKEVDGRRFYNDSKATNIVAASKALEAFETPTILLAGGLDRGNEFGELKPYLKCVKLMVTFGETAAKLERVAKELNIETLRVKDVAEAVPVAYQHSAIGDCVLLSPACASWDQYRTFEERGQVFVTAVEQLG